MKKRLLQLVTLCLILTAFVSVLTACGTSTLEEAVSKDKSVQKELDRVGKKNNMDINIKDNLVTYVYFFIFTILIRSSCQDIICRCPCRRRVRGRRDEWW